MNIAIVFATEYEDSDESTIGNLKNAAHQKETQPGIYRNLTFGTEHTEYEPCIAELLELGMRIFTGEFWYLGEENWNETIVYSGKF